jgi:hypothetical protein
MGTDSNCLLLYPNNVVTATISGGNWQPSWPIANIATRFNNQVARSVDCQPINTIININFGSLVYNTAVALLNHNLTLQAQARVLLYKDAAMSQLAFDSGFNDVWPRWFDTMGLRWADSNFWYGRIPAKWQGKVPALFLQLLNTAGFNANATSSWTCQIQISDPNNPAGYIQIGRAFMGEDFTPQINMEYGASVQIVDPSKVERALSGTKWFNQKPRYRKFIVEFKYLSKDEAVNSLLITDLLAGLTDDVLYVDNPGDPRFLQQMSCVGTLSELDPLAEWMIGQYSKGLQIEESL